MKALFLILLMALPAAAAANDDEAAADVDVDRLIAQLDHDDYRVREQATERLIELDKAVRQAVEAGRSHPSPEVRWRCERILMQIKENQVADEIRRLLNDKDAKADEYELPGWPRYRKLAGADKEARSLFAAMQRAQYPLLRDHAQGGRVTGQLRDLLQSFARSYKQMTEEQRLGTTAAAFFLMVEGNTADDAQLIAYSASSLYRVNDAVNKNAALRKLVGEWVKMDFPERYAASQMSIAQRYNLRQGVHSARRLMAGKANSASTLARAMLIVGQFGEEEDLARLAKHFSDKQRLASFRRQGQERIECQIRDVALAMAIALNKQDLTEFGFSEHAKKYGFRSYAYLGFTSDEARDKAFKQWRQWRSDQQEETPDKAKPADKDAEDAGN